MKLQTLSPLLLTGFLCTGLCTATTAADVKAYGTVDMYVAMNNDGGEWTSAVQSGGASASLIGLTGTEELSNGLRAVFKLEAGMLMDDGTSAPPGGGAGYIFQRESWVGLESDRFGKLTLGRQYSPFFMTLILADPGNMSMGSAIGNYCWPNGDGILGGLFGPSDISRRDNSILYATPNFSGFSAEVFAALGEVERTDGQTSSTLGNAYDIALQYAGERLFLRTTLLAEELSAEGYEHRTDRYWVAAATYDLGFTKPSVIFTKKFSRDTENAPDVWALQLGATTPLGHGTLLTSAAYLKNETVSDADTLSFGTRYDYPLSHRTKLYAGAAVVLNDDLADNVVIPGPGSSAPFSIEKAGNNQTQFFFGINHSF